MSSTIAITGTQVTSDPKKSTFVYTFPSGSVRFDPDHEIALKSLNMYYSVFNITAANANNTFSYLWYSGAGPTITTVNITIPDGYYDVAGLNAYLQSVMFSNGHYLITSTGNIVYYIEFLEDSSQYAVQLNTYQLPTAAQAAALLYTAPGTWPGYVTANITPRVIVPATNFIYVIGFAAGTYPPATQAATYSTISTFTPQVTPLASIFILCSLLQNPYGIPNTILYNTPPTAAFGAQMNIMPSTLDYNLVQPGNYASFTIQFTDQNFVPLVMQDANITLLLSIRRRPRISQGE